MTNEDADKLVGGAKDKGSPRSTQLSGQFLVALSSMGDPRFTRAVIYLCSHSDQGAMGLVINKTKGIKDAENPNDVIRMSHILDQIGIEGKIRVADRAVLEGGPVDIERGFVLHSADYYSPTISLRLSKTLCLSSAKDVLEVLMTDEAPERAVLAIGYAGWGAGQLEKEIKDNAWMVIPANESLIFDTDMERKWAAALAEIGVSPDMLSATGGSA